MGDQRRRATDVLPQLPFCSHDTYEGTCPSCRRRAGKPYDDLAGSCIKHAWAKHDFCSECARSMIAKMDDAAERRSAAALLERIDVRAATNAFHGAWELILSRAKDESERDRLYEALKEVVKQDRFLRQEKVAESFPGASWRGRGEDGSVGFDCEHEGRRVLVTLAKDGDVEILIPKTSVPSSLDGQVKK